MARKSRSFARAAGAALWTVAGCLAAGVAIAQDLSLGPLGKDQIRRKLLDECIYAEFRQADADQSKIAGRCQCASTRVTKPMKPADVEAYNRDASVVSARSAELRAALAGC